MTRSPCAAHASLARTSPAGATGRDVILVGLGLGAFRGGPVLFVEALSTQGSFPLLHLFKLLITQTLALHSLGLAGRGFGAMGVSAPWTYGGVGAVKAFRPE